MSAWIPTCISGPPLVDGESEFVLVASQKVKHPVIAQLIFTEDVCAGRDDPPGCEQWKQFGRDGYDIDGVTHWMPLPPMP